MTPQLSVLLVPGKLRLGSEEPRIECMLQKKQNHTDSWVPDHLEMAPIKPPVEASIVLILT